MDALWDRAKAEASLAAEDDLAAADHLESFADTCARKAPLEKAPGLLRSLSTSRGACTLPEPTRATTRR